jgi:hypothetical protein
MVTPVQMPNFALLLSTGCDASAVRAFWGYEEGGTMSGFRYKQFKWTQDLKNAIWRTTVEQWRDGEGHWEGAVVLLGVPFT